MTNIYIDQGIEQDAHNDMNIVLQLRTQIGNAIHHAQKAQNAGAMAYNESMLDEVIDKLDDILANIIQPVETLIEQGERYHEQNSNAA